MKKVIFLLTILLVSIQVIAQSNKPQPLDPNLSYPGPSTKSKDYSWATERFSTDKQSTTHSKKYEDGGDSPVTVYKFSDGSYGVSYNLPSNKPKPTNTSSQLIPFANMQSYKSTVRPINNNGPAGTLNIPRSTYTPHTQYYRVTVGSEYKGNSSTYNIGVSRKN